MPCIPNSLPYKLTCVFALQTDNLFFPVTVLWFWIQHPPCDTILFCICIIKYILLYSTLIGSLLCSSDPASKSASIPIRSISLMNPDNMHVITNFQIELYHATFLVKSQYFIDILDGFKLFEVSLHHLQFPRPRALFRGTTSVREAGFFFNIETTLSPPLGPFHTEKAIRSAAIAYLHSHGFSPPTQCRKYEALDKDKIRMNKAHRLNSSLNPSQKMTMMIRPCFHWHTCLPTVEKWDGLGLDSSELIQFIRKARKGVYLYPLSNASESNILWDDSVGNQPGWAINTYNHNTRKFRGGPIISTEIRSLFYRP